MATMSNLTTAQARKSLSLGYPLPIIGGALAIVFGLAVYDVTGTSFSIWIWTIIFAILGVSLVLGTRFAAASNNFASVTGKSVGASRGAMNLNFILGIIWSAVVAITSYVSAMQSVGSLRVFRYIHTYLNKTGNKPNLWTRQVADVQPFKWNWLLNNFLPTFVLLILVIVGTYLLLAERGREPKLGEATESEAK
jgi:hypothetical protein